jgi:UDP-N-acetylglucosamine 4,6-dehydratase
MKVLITGNGSFTNAMIERLLTTDVSKIIIYSRNEKNQVDTRLKFNDNRLEFVIGDVRDYKAICGALKGVDYCIHAAALKHIDKCEKHPMEAVKTNVFGSINVIEACNENKVKRLVCLSTDKAANAETTYGSGKYLMEKIALGIDGDTEIVVTRYGNVLGSNGSVIPIFKKLAEEGKPLTITDRSITRFFMPMKEAVDLVEYAMFKAQDRDLIVFKNKSATVGQIADCISDNQIIIGLRCVEKSGEALLTVDELNHSEDLGNMYRVSKDIPKSDKYTEPLTSDNCEKYEMEELRVLVEEC